MFNNSHFGQNTVSPAGMTDHSIVFCSFPSSSSRGYTQVLETRHFGRDAEIQRPGMANQGPRHVSLYSYPLNYGLASYLNQTLVQPTGYRPWPGFRHPCRNDGFSGLPGFVYNDESSSLGMQSWKFRLPTLSQARACRAKVPKLELQCH